MIIVRITLKLPKYLKKKAEKRVFEIELQKEVKKIIFKTHNLGKPLDNLKRTDFYSNPA